MLGTSSAPARPARSALPVPKRVSPAVLAMFGLAAVGFLVYAVMLAHAAYGEQPQADRFLAAPRCVANATPAGDCVAWQIRTVC